MKAEIAKVTEHIDNNFSAPVMHNAIQKIKRYMVDHFKRYQVGLMLVDLYPSLDSKCACGCGCSLPERKKRWYSNECRDSAYITFAIIKGDVSVIREHLYLIDRGACRSCGLISDDWEADHILPVYMGGGACDISNFQTLCNGCHKEKSRENLTMQGHYENQQVMKVSRLKTKI
jgi:5-methylcytosine-specific restriction endonuclease McrA